MPMSNLSDNKYTYFMWRIEGKFKMSTEINFARKHSQFTISMEKLFSASVSTLSKI